jgi:hypothetical protein
MFCVYPLSKNNFTEIKCGRGTVTVAVNGAEVDDGISLERK